MADGWPLQIPIHNFNIHQLKIVKNENQIHKMHTQMDPYKIRKADASNNSYFKKFPK